MSTRARYMPALDGLRAVAVLAVLAYHAGAAWVPGGYFGVDAFFVLSGFLITTLLVNERTTTGRIAMRAFWVRRARRLLPALVLVILFVALYAAIAARPVELAQLRRDGLATMFYFANWSQIFGHASYFEQFAPSALRHTWSLAIEEQFYFIWPLIVFAVMRSPRANPRRVLAVAGGLAAASAVWMVVLYQPGRDPSRVYYGTDTRAQSLLIGAVAGILLLRREQADPNAPRTVALRRASHWAALAAAVALGFIWSSTGELDAWQYRGGFTLAAVLVAVVIAGVTDPVDPGLLGRALSFTPLRAVGMISYGLYLWHWPVYVWCSPDRTGLDGAPLAALRLAITFALATTSYLAVERPVRFGTFPRPAVRVLVPATAIVVAACLLIATMPGRGADLLSAAQAGPVPDVTPTGGASAEWPQRVLVVGDSVAASMVPGIADRAAGSGAALRDATSPGCGLATDVGQRWVGRWIDGDPVCAPGWRSRWAQQRDEFRPDVTVVLVGAQDTFDRRIDGRVVEFDTPEGLDLARRDLEEAVAVLTASGGQVVLLTTPYYTLGWPMPIDEDRSLFNPAWIDRYNQLQRDVAAAAGGRVKVLDLNRLLGPDGKWTATVGDTEVRTFDKMHLSGAGAAMVGDWLFAELRALGATGGSRPG